MEFKDCYFFVKYIVFCKIYVILLHNSGKIQTEETEMENMEHKNLTLLTDLYELTMMQGYFKEKDANETVVFDMFYRNNPHGNGFAICAGLEQVIEYIENLRIFWNTFTTSASRGISTPFRKEPWYFRESLWLKWLLRLCRPS